MQSACKGRLVSSTSGVFKNSDILLCASAFESFVFARLHHAVKSLNSLRSSPTELLVTS